jgi:hypothetical protein
MSEEKQPERRRKRECPSCGAASMIRGCRVPGVQLQIVTGEGDRSGLIGLYSDVCVDCGLTSFYARRSEVASQMQEMRGEGVEGLSGPGGSGADSTQEEDEESE